MSTMQKPDLNYGISMILSPAKTLDLTPLCDRSFAYSDVNADVLAKLSNEYSLSPCDEAKTEYIVQTMKSKSESELKSLLKLSPALAKSSHGYWSKFDMSSRNSSNNFGMFTFAGPAFQQGIIPQNCNLSTLAYLARHLYILDPVYGVVRAMDRIQPYRLEMGCKGLVDEKGSKKKETLASYWKGSITTHIGNHMSIQNSADGGPILTNLASEEYSCSIDIPSLPPNTTFVNIMFRHGGRVVAVHAKCARGLMARYIAERGAKSLSDISDFDLEGYQCKCVSNSSGEKEELWETVDVVGDNVRIVNMLFDRDNVPPSAKQAKRKELHADVKSSKRKK